LVKFHHKKHSIHVLLDISQNRLCTPKYGYFSEDQIFWNFFADTYYIEGLNMSCTSSCKISFRRWSIFI